MKTIVLAWIGLLFVALVFGALLGWPWVIVAVIFSIGVIIVVDKVSPKYVNATKWLVWGSIGVVLTISIISSITPSLQRSLPLSFRAWHHTGNCLDIFGYQVMGPDPTSDLQKSIIESNETINAVRTERIQKLMATAEQLYKDGKLSDSNFETMQYNLLDSLDVIRQANAKFMTRFSVVTDTINPKTPWTYIIIKWVNLFVVLAVIFGLIGIVVGIRVKGLGGFYESIIASIKKVSGTAWKVIGWFVISTGLWIAIGSVLNDSYFGKTTSNLANNHSNLLFGLWGITFILGLALIFKPDWIKSIKLPHFSNRTLIVLGILGIIVWWKWPSSEVPTNYQQAGMSGLNTDLLNLPGFNPNPSGPPPNVNIGPTSGKFTINPGGAFTRSTLVLNEGVHFDLVPDREITDADILLAWVPNNNPVDIKPVLLASGKKGYHIWGMGSNNNPPDQRESRFAMKDGSEPITLTWQHVNNAN